MKAIVLSAALLAASLSSVLADTEAPLITSASISPNTADVSGGADTVTATLTVTDNDTGFTSGNLFYYNPSDNYVSNVHFTGANRISGDALNGVYEVTVTVPEFGAPGDWRIDGLVTDGADNTRYYNPQPEGTPFPVPEDMVITVSNTGTVDSLAPDFGSASVSPEVADPSSSPVTLTFTIAAGDDLSGLDYGFIYPQNPSNNTEVGLITFFSDSNRVSGDEYSGEYEVEITFPQGSQLGGWTFDVYLKDKVGNANYFQPAGTFTFSTDPPPPAVDATFLGHALDAVHLPFTTSGTGWFIGENDTNDGIDSAWPRPVPDGGSSSMSTSVTGPGTLRFFWRASTEENEDILSVDIPSASIHHEISGETFWEEQVLTIPPGTHAVTWSYEKSASGSANQDMVWIDQVGFVAQSDSELPRLQALSISPGTVDAQNPESVIITMEITDDHHGFAIGKVELVNPSGNIDETQFFDFNQRVTGNDQSGVYEVSFPMDENETQGIWRVNVELTENVTLLSRQYGPGSDPFPLPDSERFHYGDPEPADTGAPALRKMEIFPSTANVTSGDVPVIVTLHVTDLPSGYDNGHVSIRNPDGGWTGDYYLSRITGNEFNGIYQAEAVAPAFGSPGTWSVGVNLWDYTPNYVNYPEETVFPPGIDPEFQVTNTGTEDTEPPFLTIISVNPSSIDTTSAPANIQVTVTLGDAVSGVLEAFAYFYDPNNQFRGELFTILDGNNRTSGDFMNGTYQFSRTLPIGSTPGNWHVEIFLRDRTGRIRIFGTNHDPYPSGSGVFTVAGAGGNWFATKMAQSSLTGNDALLGADPDKDGKTNAEEVAAGDNPAVADGAGFSVIQRTPTHLYLVFELAPSLTVGTSGDYLTFGDSGMQPMRLTGEIQNGLTGAWTKVPPEFVSGSTWRVGIPLTGGPQGFVRLRFENP